MSRYSDAVEAVFGVLGDLASRSQSPTMLCLPDLFVWEGVKRTSPPEDSERAHIAIDSDLDGHACISALTMAHLTVGLAGDFSVWLVAKFGDDGEVLLQTAVRQRIKSSGGLFRYFRVRGETRRLHTLKDTESVVRRRITHANSENDPSWAELRKLGIPSWIESRKFGMLIGDPESRLVKEAPEEVAGLAGRSAAAVIDTSYWGSPPHGDAAAKNMWQSIRKLCDAKTFVSVSDKDAINIAAALDFIGSAEESAKHLAKELPGFVVLHANEANRIYSRDLANPVFVPAADINPRSTNGAGDTFNGGLALALTSFGLGSSDPFGPSRLETALTFATAVVSLRLEDGRYPTRAALQSSAADLREKSSVSQTPAKPEKSLENPAVAAVEPWLAPVVRRLTLTWCDVPKLALIDLDHTLCDSRLWRETAAMEGFRALGLARIPDRDWRKLFERIYGDHGNWTNLIDGQDIRYRWPYQDGGLFQIAKALDDRHLWNQYERLGTQFLKDNDRDIRARLDRVKRESAGEIRTAVDAFAKVAAYPREDVIGGLLQMRDILGFQLAIVTEGDLETQRWKMEKLGLNAIIRREDVYAEDAYASAQDVRQDFFAAIGRTDLEGSQRSTLVEAMPICLNRHEELKNDFRSRKLIELVEKTTSDGGTRKGTPRAYVCTMGDRLETDVRPYCELKEKGCIKPGGGDYWGLVITRIKRGEYRDEPDLDGHRPDEVSSSMTDMVKILARPRFWENRPPIEEVNPVPLREFTAQQIKILDEAALIDPRIERIVNPLLDRSARAQGQK